MERFKEAVEQAYWEYPEETLSRIHALQYQIYRELLTDSGGNEYKLPHSAIRKRQNNGVQVVDYSLSREVYRSAIAALGELRDAIDEL